MNDLLNNTTKTKNIEELYYQILEIVKNLLQFCDCHYEKSEILLKIFHPFIFLQEFHQKQT